MKLSKSMITCIIAFMCLFSLLPILIFGCIISAILFPGVYKAQASKSWKETPCVVTSYKSTESFDSDNGSTRYTYYTYATYYYTFNGKDYSSSLYSGTDLCVDSKSYSNSQKNYISDFEKQNPPGTELKCYVNPKNPEEAVLKTGFSRDNIIALEVLIGFFLFSILVTVIFFFFVRWIINKIR